AIAIVHGPVLRAQALSLDDPQFILDNPLVTHPSASSAARFFREVLNPSTVRGYYIPLTMTSLMADYAMGGRADDLRVFPRTHLPRPASASWSWWFFLSRFFGSAPPAVIAGLAFGLHPLTVEPVAWVAERKTLLASVLALGSIVCYVEACRR